MDLERGISYKSLNVWVFSYLKLLLAGPHVDISAPDHQFLACVWFTGYCTISTWLWGGGEQS